MSKYHAHHHKDEHSHTDKSLSNHEHSSHTHEHRQHTEKAFKVIMFVTAVFAAVEFLGGIWTNSLALVSDSIHMLTDSSAIFLALLMSHISKQPADNNHSFGHGRAETLGAFINALFMLVIIGYLIYESFHKFLNPEPVKSTAMLAIATIGLIINIIGMKLLDGHNHTLNSKAAYLHLVGDMVSSVGAIVAAIIIQFTNWYALDAAVSLCIALILIPSTWSVLANAVHILMEGVPKHIDYDLVGQAMDKIEGVKSIHDLHVWVMNSDHAALSAHVQIQDPLQWETVLTSMQKMLAKEFDIHHVALQPEYAKGECLFGCNCSPKKEN